MPTETPTRGKRVLKTYLFDRWPGTLGELARTIGISVSMLSRVRAGEREPGPDFVLSACQAFGLPKFDVIDPETGALIKPGLFYEAEVTSGELALV